MPEPISLKTSIATCFFLLLQNISFAQQPVAVESAIDVTEQTLKIGGTKSEEIMFGFAKGDIIVFNFSEINGKELKEIEIIEFPSASKFSDYKTSKITNKTLTVQKQGVYLFRFKNSALSGRVCNIRIQRIPVDGSSLNFNTAVQWVTKQDTSWNSYTKDVVVGYDTVYQQKTKKELVNSVQREELLLDKMQRVHSTTNSNGNKTFVFFTLPNNQQTGNTVTQTISWAYWVGVGEEANASWRQNTKTMQSLVKNGTALFATPLGALAIGAMVELMTPKLGEDVQYSLMNAQNKEFFMAGLQARGWDNGKGVAGYKKFTDPAMCQGTYFICMSNDNLMQGIDVNVRVVAIVETKEYKDETYTDIVVRPRFEKQLFKDPVIKTSTVPVTVL